MDPILNPKLPVIQGKNNWRKPGTNCLGFRQSEGFLGDLYLVAVEAVVIAGLESHLKVPAIEFAVTEPRVVVLVSVPIGAAIAKVATATPTTIAIVTALLQALVVAGVQRRLAEFVTAPVWIRTVAITAT